MASFIHVSLILATIITQMSSGNQEKCRKKFHSVEVVAACPTTKKDVDIAARRKNCTKLNLAAQKNCMTGNKPYVYHCVINGFRNETLEVCAQEKLIFGFCTEFNVAGGVIQRHALGQCNSVFPICDKKYISSDAFKYPDCYKLAYENQAFTSTSSDFSNSSDFETTTVSSQEKTTYSEKNHKKKPALGAVVILVTSCIIFSSVCLVSLKLVLRKKLRRRGRSEDGSISSIDYIYLDAKHLSHFQYVYKLTRNCSHRLVNVCTGEDISDFMSEDVMIRIKVVGDFTEENLNLLSKGKGKRNQRRKKHRNVWKTALLLCFQNHSSLKSALQSLRIGHACHKILIQSEESFAKTKKADNSVFNVGQNKQQIKKIITSCLETQLDEILHVWLEKLKTKGSLKQRSEMIAEIDAIRKQLILDTNKKTAASDVPWIDNKSIVPNDVKEYLFRRLDVIGFGIWRCSAFQIFVKMATDDKSLMRELIKLNKNFFEKYPPNIEKRNMIEKQTMRRYDSTSLQLGRIFSKIIYKTIR